MKLGRSQQELPLAKTILRVFRPDRPSKRLTPKAMQAGALVEALVLNNSGADRGLHRPMKLRTRSASCQMSSYCGWVIGTTHPFGPACTFVEGVLFHLIDSPGPRLMFDPRIPLPGKK